MSLHTPAAPSLDARNLLIGVVMALIVGVVLVSGIGRLAGFAEVGDTLDGAVWQWLAISAVGQMVVFAGYAGAFRAAVAFEDGPVVARKRALRVILASFGLTQLVAAGGAAGLAFTYWALRRVGFERETALVRLIGLNTAVYLVFGVIGWISGFFALVRPEIPVGVSLAWLAAIPLIIVAASWFTDEERVARWTSSDGGRLRQAVGVGVESAAWVRRAMADPQGRRVLGWSVLYWLGDLASLWAALRAFGASVGPAQLGVAYTTGYLAQAVPIPFVATGGVDAATTFMLRAVGVPIEIALIAVVAHRIFAFWLPIAPGLWSAARLATEARHEQVTNPIVPE